MIALDTNLLVRFLVEDDAEQTRRAEVFLQRAVDTGQPCYVGNVVLCELVWVLETRYKVRRPEIIQVLGNLMKARHLVFGSIERLARALEAYRSGRGDFADYVIQEDSRDFGCEAVATFDGDLLKEPGFISP